MKGALFDLDGVLIDSESLYTEFWNNIDSIYPTGVENFAIKIKGTTLDLIFRHFPDAEIQSDILHRLNRFQREMRFKMYPHAEDFLCRLRDAGIPMALVTSSDEKKMESLFSQIPALRTYFYAIIHAGLVSHSKPHPEPYLKGAAAIGIAPEDCCVFEDSLQGLTAGRASGAKVIALATTYPAERLVSMADKVISDFSELDISTL